MTSLTMDIPGQMSFDQLDRFVQQSAAEYGIPAALVHAIIQQESQGYPFATRYEAAFFNSYVSGKGHKVYGFCSRATEERGRAMSWGLMQIMGQTAREEGYTEMFLANLCTPAANIMYGCKHLQSRAARLPTSKGFTWQDVCAAYNTGLGNVKTPGKWTINGQTYVRLIGSKLGNKWPTRTI